MTEQQRTCSGLRKTKQVLLHGDSAIHRTGDSLLGGANTRGGSGRRVETDITGKGGHPPPDPLDYGDFGGITEAAVKKFQGMRPKEKCE